MPDETPDMGERRRRRRAEREVETTSERPLTRRERRARDEAIATGALELGSTGEIVAFPGESPRPEPTPSEPLTSVPTPSEPTTEDRTPTASEPAPQEPSTDTSGLTRRELRRLARSAGVESATSAPTPARGVSAPSPDEAASEPEPVATAPEPTAPEPAAPEPAAPEPALRPAPSWASAPSRRPVVRPTPVPAVPAAREPAVTADPAQPSSVAAPEAASTSGSTPDTDAPPERVSIWHPVTASTPEGSAALVPAPGSLAPAAPAGPAPAAAPAGRSTPMTDGAPLPTTRRGRVAAAAAEREAPAPSIDAVITGEVEQPEPFRATPTWAQLSTTPADTMPAVEPEPAAQPSVTDRQETVTVPAVSPVSPVSSASTTTAADVEAPSPAETVGAHDDHQHADDQHADDLDDDDLDDEDDDDGSTPRWLKALMTLVLVVAAALLIALLIYRANQGDLAAAGVIIPWAGSGAPPTYPSST